MDMTFGKKEVGLLIGLFGVLLAVGAWFLYTSPTLEKTAALKTENEVLSAKAETYSAVNARLSDYENGIVEAKNARDEITDHYPSEIKIQDSVMFWANIDNAYPFDAGFADLELETIDAVAVAGVEDLGGATLIEKEDGQYISDDEIEDVTAKYVLYGAPAGMNFASTYGGMKKVFNYVNSQYDRNSIDQVDLYYDEETGLLQGTIWVTQYYLQGLDKDYSPAFIPSVPKGQSDVFHTGAISMDALNDAPELEEPEN